MDKAERSKMNDKYLEETRLQMLADLKAQIPAISPEAAQGLLEACKAMLADRHDCPHDTRNESCLICKAKAAISRAEGK